MASATIPPATETTREDGAALPLQARPGGPPGGLTIEEYCRIKIELWAAGADLHELLEEHGVDEIQWRVHEKWQADALAAEAREGRCDLALALMAAFEGAQSQADKGPPELLSGAEPGP